MKSSSFASRRSFVTLAFAFTSLLAPACAWGSATITRASGTVATNTELGPEFAGGPQFCVCKPSVDIGLPLGGNPSPSPSASLGCPDCDHTYFGGQQGMVTTANSSASFSGDSTRVTMESNGRTGTCANAQCGEGAGTTGTIEFSISGQSTSVSISVSASASGDTSGNVQLSGPGGTSELTFDSTGTKGSIPASVSAIGTYSLSYFVEGATDNTQHTGISYTLNITVATPATPADLHWIHGGNGRFTDAANWNPMQTPRAVDRTFFDLPNAPAITVVAQNASVAALTVDQMNVELDGSAHVFGSNGTSLVVGHGRLTLGAGTTLTTSQISSIDRGSDPTINVTGAGTKWSSSGIEMAFQGAASLAVQHDATLNDNLHIFAGNGTGAGAISVQDGGKITTPEFDGSNGTIDINGVSPNGRSTLEVTTKLDLSSGSVATASSLTIENGGKARLADVLIGKSGEAGVKKVTISGVSTGGQPSSLTSSGNFTVAGAPGTQVEVVDGAILSTNGAVIGRFVDPARVVVHEKSGNFHALWTDSSDVAIGSQLTPSELFISNGGSVLIGGALTVGGVHGDVGSATVTGTDASLHIGSAAPGATMILGLFGHGQLNIQDGAKVVSPNAVFGLSVGTPGTSDFDAGSGNVIINASTGNSELDVTTNCVVGSGDFAPANVTLFGLPFISGAKLAVGNQLVVGKAGSITGNGTLSAVQTVNNGFISPGLSPGRIDVVGDYEQTAAGKLRVEAAGVGNGQADILHISGKAKLDGTLEINFLNGYAPKKGNSFKFIQVEGTTTGSFARITFPQLAPGFQFSNEIVSGGVQFTAANDAVLAPVSLANISTRALVGIGDDVLIGGFIVQGTGPKKVMIRAIGPSLSRFGVAGALSDPLLELHDGTGATIAQNDNWTVTQLGGVLNASQVSDIQASSLPPQDPAESALIATLNPGNYTAIVRGVNGSTGVALAEVYDLSAPATARLANISTRGVVQIGDQVMIGGLIIGNQTTRTVVRAIGPSLAQLGVADALTDPLLELHNGQGDTLSVNDNWRSNQESELMQSGLAPTNDAEAAILANLIPGAYTAIVRGAGGQTGVALVEAYALP